MCSTAEVWLIMKVQSWDVQVGLVRTSGTRSFELPEPANLRTGRPGGRNFGSGNDWVTMRVDALLENLRMRKEMTLGLQSCVLSVGAREASQGTTKATQVQ